MKDQIDLSKMQSIQILNKNNFLRLHRYWKSSDFELWDKIWNQIDSKSFWKQSRSGFLDPFYDNYFFKYLTYRNRKKKDIKILEAGCGMGQIVIALRKKGFECYGLDFAKNIISILRKEFPDHHFQHGDIRQLPYKNSFFDGYISLGVIEHF